MAILCDETSPKKVIGCICCHNRLQDILVRTNGEWICCHCIEKNRMRLSKTICIDCGKTFMAREVQTYCWDATYGNTGHCGCRVKGRKNIERIHQYCEGNECKLVHKSLLVKLIQGR